MPTYFVVHCISMPDSNVVAPQNELIDIDFRNPLYAGLLAWLVPGLGHYYQRRYHKALIFFLCIVPTFVAGCVLASNSAAGTARNVYWSWRSADMRFWWLVQAPLGMAAIPSCVQAWQLYNGLAPPFGKFMAPPKLYHFDRDHTDRSGVPPVLDELRKKMPYYELGTYLTVIAGLMNLLVIFDAIDGPFLSRSRASKQ